MALPFIIGGLVAGLLAKKIYDDNNTPNYSSEDNSRQRAERERELQQEQAKKERDKKRQFARDDFSTRGEAIGSDISQILQGWISVSKKETPAFAVNLTDTGYCTNNSNEIENEGEFIEILLRMGCFFEPHCTDSGYLLEETLANLKKYIHLYAVELIADTRLRQTLEQTQKINVELNQISSMQETIKQLELQILREEV